MNLTAEAKSALISAAARQGAVPTGIGAGNEEVTHELAKQGLIGGNGGLTRKGVTARAKAVSEALDVAF